MENRNITTKIIVCSYDELNEEEKKLIDAAKEATNRSYSPYSRFQVGAAALLSGGTVITGSNQENAAYPSGICAERTTLFYANSQYPDLPVEALAIAAQTSGDFIDHPTAPCGACRQVILETEANENFIFGLTMPNRIRYSTNIVKGECRGKRKSHFWIDYAEPYLIYSTNIGKEEGKIK